MVLFILLWGSINILSLLVFKNVTDDDILSFFHITTYPVIAYLVLKIIGVSFFKRIENIVYFLTLFSLPIFFYQLYNPDFFFGLGPLLNQYTILEQQMEGGWYIGIYMFSGWAFERNSGFMWEPGAFAFMLILAIFFRLSYNNYKFDKRIIVYIVAILTTFSTMGYIVTFLLIMFFLSRKKSLLIYVYVIPLFISLAVYSINEFEFLGDKLIEYTEAGDEIGRTSEVAGDRLRMTRFGIFTFALEESLKWPLGFGIFETTPAVLKYGEPVTGPNTYAQVLLRWGFLGVILLLAVSWKYIKYAFEGLSKYSMVLLYLAFMFSIFSYNHLNNIMLYVIFFAPFIFEKKTFHHRLLKIKHSLSAGQ